MEKDFYPVLFDELEKIKAARNSKNHTKCELHFGRAHILSQKNFFVHICIHFTMFMYSFGRRDYKEMRGQLLRALLVVPGHVLRILPRGNTGWSSVGLTEEMTLPKDLEKYFL